MGMLSYHLPTQAYADIHSIILDRKIPPVIWILLAARFHIFTYHSSIYYAIMPQLMLALVGHS
jgi:hypothetical protein